MFIAEDPAKISEIFLAGDLVAVRRQPLISAARHGRRTRRGAAVVVAVRLSACRSSPGTTATASSSRSASPRKVRQVAEQRPDRLQRRHRAGPPDEPVQGGLAVPGAVAGRVEDAVADDRTAGPPVSQLEPLRGVVRRLEHAQRELRLERLVADLAVAAAPSAAATRRPPPAPRRWPGRARAAAPPRASRRDAGRTPPGRPARPGRPGPGRRGGRCAGRRWPATVSSAAVIPSPMPFSTVRYSRPSCSAQSKLSPRTAYDGSSCPARLNDGRIRHRPGSSSHCISAASVSRRVRAAIVYRSVPAPAGLQLVGEQGGDLGEFGPHRARRPARRSSAAPRSAHRGRSPAGTRPRPRSPRTGGRSCARPGRRAGSPATR